MQSEEKQRLLSALKASEGLIVLFGKPAYSEEEFKYHNTIVSLIKMMDSFIKSVEAREVLDHLIRTLHVAFEASENGDPEFWKMGGDNVYEGILKERDKLISKIEKV